MSAARRVRRARHAFWPLLACLAGTAGATDAKVAIIIDDLGNQRRLGQRAVRLPAAVAIAVLPHTPFGYELAQEAYDRGKEVLVHVPMQAEQRELDLGPGALHLGQTRVEFMATLASAVAAVPYASGLNNHMGSLLTRNSEHMGWLMGELRRSDLFFIDSYTTHLSVGLGTARERGVPALKRDVFLDGEPERASIAGQWARLLNIADETGFAVAIAHPYPITLEFLEAVLPELEAADYTVVPLRMLLPWPAAQQSEEATVRPIGGSREPVSNAAGTLE